MTLHAPLLLTLGLLIAEALLKMTDPNPPPMAVLGDRSPTKDKAENEHFLKTQAKALKSDKVLRAALRRPGIAKLRTVCQQNDPVAWLRQNLETDIRKNLGTVRVWLRGGRRGDQAALVNAVVDALLEEEANERRRWIEVRIKGLETFQEAHRNTLTVLLHYPPHMRNEPRIQRQVQMLQNDLAEGEREFKRLRDELKKPSRIAVVRRTPPQR